jgi:RNA polymerase sigma factor (sigma-70 family)
MMTTNQMSTPVPNDADLVHASLAGDRGAFGQIVARYQSLVCSLAYSATGSLNRSEDLAQETFVAAWQRLPALREPAKLRAWLCGIARNLISNAQRRAGREPAHLAGPLDATPEAIAPEPSPPEQVVTKEEAAILWRALEKIPETYREPLVLFYREHKSVEAVARELDLTEDAVKQRLSRGRALLHEQVLALVEVTLERSSPGRAFTGSVLAALPVMGTGLAVGAGAAAATTQGAASAKSAPWLGVLGALLTAQVLWFVSSVAFVVGLGAFAGWQMGNPARSPAEQRWSAWFWRLLVGGLIAFVLVPLLGLKSFWAAHPSYTGVLQMWLGLFYVVPAIPLALWAIANHNRIRTPATGAALTPATVDKWFHGSVLAATIAMLGMLVSGFVGSHWYNRIRPDEVWGIVAAHPEARISVLELKSGHRWIEVVVPGNGRTSRYDGPLDASTAALLTSSGRRYETRIEGRDYNALGWPGRWLGPVALFATAAGIVILVRARLPRKPSAESASQDHLAGGSQPSTSGPAA